VLGTVGVGYDWHLRDRWVLGAFADFDFSNTEHKEHDWWPGPPAGYAGWKMEKDYAWTIGARIGLVTTNTSMVYGIIGYSQADYNINVYEENGVDTPVSIDKTLTFRGLTLGAGLEHDLGNGFSLKGEYRYTDYHEEDFGSHTPIGSTTDTEYDDFDFDSHSVRLSLVYKFGRREEPIEHISYKDIPPAPPYK
jgi:outer membrane immunogenic protein